MRHWSPRRSPMKRTFVVALLGLLASSRAWAQASSSVEQDIIKLEQAATDAQFKKDRAALERLLADDYLYTHSNGSVLNKAQEITESMSSEVRWTDSKLADLKVRIFGDAAVLTGRQTIQGTAKGYVPGPRRITDMFVKRSGRWQWAGGQATLEPTKYDAPPLSAQDVAAIKATLATWKQAGLAGDWPSFFGEFTEDAVWMGPKGPPVEGLAAIRKGTWFRALEEELVSVQIDGRADLAFARGTVSLLLDEKGAVKREGNFLTVLRKQPGGSWRMAVYSVGF